MNPDDVMSRAWGPPDVSVPSLARVWDELLGGKNALQVDRDTVAQMCETFPGWRQLALMQRRFVGRAVEHLVGDLGVRQLIDLGCGFPSLHLRNVHEIAVCTDPAVRVVYVDHDPVVLAHARVLVSDDRTSASILADVTDPGAILDHPVTRRLLDLDQPYAILLAGVLHHLGDEQDPVGVTDQVKAAMPAGSYLVVCNFLGDDGDTETVAADAEQGFDKAFGGHARARFRSWAEQLPYLAGLDPIPPGLVYADEWRPDEFMRETPKHTLLCAGVGRKAAA